MMAQVSGYGLWKWEGSGCSTGGYNPVPMREGINENVMLPGYALLFLLCLAQAFVVRSVLAKIINIHNQVTCYSKCPILHREISHTVLYCKREVPFCIKYTLPLHICVLYVGIFFPTS
jgi:hypothetical protein